MITRRSFITMMSVAAGAVALPQKATALQRATLVTTEARQYIAEKNANGTEWVTMALDEQGALEEIARYDKLSEENLRGPARAGVAVSIAVYVGSALAGYVIGTVVDGIVISATGQSGAAWVSQAINRLVGRPVPPSRSIRLSCNVYPPNSMEYIRCMRS